MHELSIAQALLNLAAEHAPAGTIVRKVHVRAGPMRGIDPDALQFAWQSVAAGHRLEGAVLDVMLMPWTLHCPQCQRKWTADSVDGTCSCGCDRASIVGGDDLVLESLDVDDEPSAVLQT